MNTKMIPRSCTNCKTAILPRWITFWLGSRRAQVHGERPRLSYSTWILAIMYVSYDCPCYASSSGPCSPHFHSTAMFESQSKFQRESGTYIHCIQVTIP